MKIDSAIVVQITGSLAQYLKRDPATIKPFHHLRDDLGLDSMAVIELLYKIEETFNLQIPDHDLPGLTTVEAVAGYVQKHLEPVPQPTSSATKKSRPKSKKR